MQILAEYAVQRIVIDREHNLEQGEDEDAKVAYLIDQVKRPEEVELLRALYRNLFYLVGVTKPYTQRRRLLQDEGVFENDTEELMDIDRNEEGKGGQRLDKALHLSDFFIRNDSTLDSRNSISRFINLIHGDKAKTPDRLETGMYAAYAAGLRSACLSRQVGASITNKAGEIIATGCNDVPSPSGGLYSVDSPTDHRCIHHEGGTCFNDSEKRKLQNQIGQVIKSKIASLNIEKNAEEAILKSISDAIYDETRLGSLIEFSRAVHAEMDAIVSLARAGTVGLKGATLFSTTFPCHSCARHIVAAGISEVYYIEPYEKSMAEQLHKDAINFEDPREAAANDPLPNKKEDHRVKFLHFEGVAPRLFAAVFRADGRKNKSTGKFIPIVKNNPIKTLPEYLDNYHTFEYAAVKHFSEIIENLERNNLTE
jgi:deoxycytidylate deaminase